MGISVVIHTYNSEEHLEKVLDSVKSFDEIVVCDMNSTDSTTQIISNYNCKVVYCDYSGGIPEPARNFAISNASHEWILVVDSDEVVPQALRTYLYDFISENDRYNGIRLNRKNYLLGHFLHDVYPDYILRFFKKNESNWPPTVHSEPSVNGEITSIPRNRRDLALIHLSNSPIRVIVDKLNTYTDFEITRRKGKKYGLWSLLLRPPFRFFQSYVIKGGFKDGKVGFISAANGAFYKYITIAKIIEANLSEKDYDRELRNSK
ncbi:MAG: glycosyl transferase family 2 [Bacteroidetes bacterium]|nr:glycosyl transferase family 2 [Bacteroidota bacterium]